MLSRTISAPATIFRPYRRIKYLLHLFFVQSGASFPARRWFLVNIEQ